jgi:hypothetical protein
MIGRPHPTVAAILEAWAKINAAEDERAARAPSGRPLSPLPRERQRIATATTENGGTAHGENAKTTSFILDAEQDGEAP